MVNRLLAGSPPRVAARAGELRRCAAPPHFRSGARRRPWGSFPAQAAAAAAARRLPRKRRLSSRASSRFVGPLYTAVARRRRARDDAASTARPSIPTRCRCGARSTRPSCVSWRATARCSPSAAAPTTTCRSICCRADLVNAVDRHRGPALLRAPRRRPLGPPARGHRECARRPLRAGRLHADAAARQEPLPDLGPHLCAQARGVVAGALARGAADEVGHPGALSQSRLSGQRRLRRRCGGAALFRQAGAQSDAGGVGAHRRPAQGAVEIFAAREPAAASARGRLVLAQMLRAGLHHGGRGAQAALAMDRVAHASHAPDGERCRLCRRLRARQLPPAARGGGAAEVIVETTLDSRAAGALSRASSRAARCERARASGRPGRRRGARSQAAAFAPSSAGAPTRKASSTAR